MFDAFARAGKNVAICAMNNCSIDAIFRKRNVDYYSLRTDEQVFAMAMELMTRTNDYDLIVCYMNDYDGKLYHYDCYRLSSGEDAEALGLTDYFYNGGICVIEWSENIKSVLPKEVKIVKIEKINEKSRKIIL